MLARGDDRLRQPYGGAPGEIVALIATAAFPLAIVPHNVLSAFVGGELES